MSLQFSVVGPTGDNQFMPRGVGTSHHQALRHMVWLVGLS